ncbi:MAG: hypothetical protein V8R01_05105 [Bacilli bacterium]
MALQAEGIDVEDEDALDVYAIAYSENERAYVMSLVNDLRLNGFNVDMDYLGRNVKNNFKR